MNSLGVVIIGRNEGERLVRCIMSLREYNVPIVYVDSASTDGSTEAAQKLNAHVVNLDMSKPFTAARARNAGFDVLVNLQPETVFVQFVDGDCEVLAGWLEFAVDFLQKHADIAAVNGILKERFPEKTIYNQLCDLEWQSQPGEIKACGGNVLMRISAFQEVKGFLPSLIAGEEPELCVRLRANGWKIWHLEQLMMLHDANISKFSQWWKRSKRAGYAFAEGAYLHGSAPEYHWVAESNRARLWGLFLPLVAFICFIFKPLLGLLVLSVYPLQIIRLTSKSKLQLKTAFTQAFFLTISKFAEAIGQLKFLWHHYTNKQSHLIEYK